MKENQHVQPAIAEDYKSIDFIVKGQPTIHFDLMKVHPDLLRRAAAVGFAQVRIVDAAAVGVADDEGNIIPEVERIAMKHANMAELVSHYESGTAEWSRVGQGGGGKSITIEAIAAVQGKEYDVVKAEVATFAAAKYAGDTKKALAFLRTGQRVAEKIDEIRKARMPKPKVDADKALEELGVKAE